MCIGILNLFIVIEKAGGGARMKFKIFKKEYELTGADFFKFISFILFTLTSMYFSINMWYELGQDIREKVAFILLSIGIDSLKTYAIIIAGGHLTSFKYFFRLRSQSKFHNILAWDKFRKFGVHILLYIIAASTSIMAITGFGLVTIDRYNKSHTSVIVSTNDEVVSLRQDIQYNEDDIEANKESISIEKETIASQKQLMKDLDKETKGYSWYIGEYQKKIDASAKKIDTYNNDNEALREKIKKITAQIRELEKKDLAQTTEKKEIRSSMFELIAKALEMDNPTTIMFLMMIIAAFVNELGIVATSPRFKNAEEENELDKLSKKESAKEKKNEVTGKEENTPLRNEKYFKENPISYAEILQSPLSFADSEVPQKESIPEKRVEELEIPERKKKDPAIQSKRGNADKQEAPEESLENSKVTAELHQQAPISSGVAEVTPPTPTLPPIRPISSPVERFVHSLFLNGGKPFLKDKDEAAKEAGLKPIQADNIFKILCKTKGNTGYPLIEFRKPEWYPNYTSEYVLATLDQMRKKKE